MDIYSEFKQTNKDVWDVHNHHGDAAKWEFFQDIGVAYEHYSNKVMEYVNNNINNICLFIFCSEKSYLW